MSKRLHCHHSKIVKWLNQIERTLWGSSRRGLQKIGWGCTSYHIFQKRDSQSMFSTKKIQNHKNRKECHEHCTIFHCIVLLHAKPAFTTFQDEGCMHLHPKNHVHVKCIDFYLYKFPKSNVLSFEFRVRGPLKESTSCFLIWLSPLVLVPIGLFHRTHSPRFYLS